MEGQSTSRRSSVSNISFVERETLGEGWIVEVRRGPELIGHIRRNRATCLFAYFPGRANSLNAAFEGPSLDAMKLRVVHDPTGTALGG